MKENLKKRSVLFVCMGNICRSPTADGVFRSMAADAGLADEIVVDSVGTHAHHVAQAPDPRAQKAARDRGYDLSELRARRAVTEDFYNFDLILAMDSDNYRSLESIQPEDGTARLQMFLDYHPEHQGGDVPDPYYGGRSGFTRVLDMIEVACEKLLKSL